MEFNQLYNFSVVAELGSITKAAAVLSIAQPALSRQIKKLEEELNIPLFHRHGHGVSLTNEGQSFLDEAQRLITDFQALKKNAASWNVGVSGKVSIGVTPTIAKNFGGDLIMRFRERYPDASLELSEGLSGHILEWLKTGKIDVGLLYDTTATKNISSEPLWKEKLDLIYSPKHMSFGKTVQLAEIAHLPVGLPSHQHALRHLLEASVKKKEASMAYVTEVNSLSIMMDIVSRGAFVGILPSSSCKNEIEQGLFATAEFIDPAVERDIVLATATHKHITRATKAAIQEIKDIAKTLNAD